MILIDSGEGSNSLLHYPPLDSLGLSARLPSPPDSDTRADVFFHGNGPRGSSLRIGIEVKEITELASSLATGRLQATQLPGLLSLYDVRWLLIITGSCRRNPSSGALQKRVRVKGGGWSWLDWNVSGRTVSYSYVQRFLVSPAFTTFVDQHGEGIRFDRVYDKREAAAWIGDLYETYQKPYESHTSMRVLDRSGNRNGLSDGSIKARLSSLHDPRINDPKFAQRVRTAGSLPHVSYTRAVALAESFPSIQQMVNPLCTCRDGLSEEEREKREREEEKIWTEVKTKDQETGKGRRLGPSLSKEIGEAVRE